MCHIFFLSRLIFPAVVTLVVTTLTFPPGFGQFMAGEVRLEIFNNWFIFITKKYISYLGPSSNAEVLNQGPGAY